MEKVRTILTRGGRVLLPVVALGRAQVTTPSLPAIDNSIKIVHCICHVEIEVVHLHVPDSSAAVAKHFATGGHATLTLQILGSAGCTLACI